MTEQELAESIYWEAEQYIPYDIQDVNLDYQVLDPGTGTDAKGTMEVLLVAAKKDKIADYTNVITQAGRQAVVVDVDAFALQNAYEANYDAGPEVVVLLNAGASATNVNIVSNGQSLFTRDVSLGGNAYTEAVQRELNLPFDAAEAAKKGLPVEGHTFDDVRPVLHAVTENVLLEIQKTFDFFKATASSDRIDRIVLSGGASAVDGFAEALAERFGIPVEHFDPFRLVAFDTPPADGVAGTGGDDGRRRGPCAPKGRRPVIRINLLAAEREGRPEEVCLRPQSADHRRVRRDPAAAAAAPSAGASGSSPSEGARIDDAITAAQKETTRLHSVIVQVQQFEQRKAQLQQRVTLIEQLRNEQIGPVHMLDQISLVAAAVAVAHRDEADRDAQRSAHRRHVRSR